MLFVFVCCPLKYVICHRLPQRKTAVTAYFSSQQLLLFAIARHCLLQSAIYHRLKQRQRAVTAYCLCNQLLLLGSARYCCCSYTMLGVVQPPITAMCAGHQHITAADTGYMRDTALSIWDRATPGCWLYRRGRPYMLSGHIVTERRVSKNWINVIIGMTYN